MNFRNHSLPVLLATAISVAVLPFAGHEIASATSDELPVPGTRETWSHPELSLPTDFWRSEFFQRPKMAEPQNPSDSESDRQNGVLSATIQNATAGFSAVSLEEELLQEYMVTDAVTGITRGIDDLDTHEMFSEWDRAAFSVIGPKGERTTREGPSVISMIVGIIGVVVVFGAYFNSARTA